MLEEQLLTVGDRFEQFQSQQRHIDHDASLVSAKRYVERYWTEAKSMVRDLRDITFKGPSRLKKLENASQRLQR